MAVVEALTMNSTLLVQRGTLPDSKGQETETETLSVIGEVTTEGA